MSLLPIINGTKNDRFGIIIIIIKTKEKNTDRKKTFLRYFVGKRVDDGVVNISFLSYDLMAGNSE